MARRTGLGLAGTLVLLILSIAFGKNLFTLTGTTPYSGITELDGEPVNADPEEEKLVEFMSFVLDDSQEVWKEQFRSAGKKYEETKLVLFRDVVKSACGTQDSAIGPFYCPADRRAYIDLSFFKELDRRFGAPGDFAQAYVLAHEVGHHIQNLTGISREVRAAQRADPSRKNELSVQLELQADCYAGVWAHDTKRRDLLETGDVAEGIGAATAVGDDTIQKKARGYVVPESFTHGSAEQRVAAFKKGLAFGTMAACDFDIAAAP